MLRISLSSNIFHLFHKVSLIILPGSYSCYAFAKAIKFILDKVLSVIISEFMLRTESCRFLMVSFSCIFPFERFFDVKLLSLSFSFGVKTNGRIFYDFHLLNLLHFSYQMIPDTLHLWCNIRVDPFSCLCNCRFDTYRKSLFCFILVRIIAKINRNLFWKKLFSKCVFNILHIGTSANTANRMVWQSKT